jgi:membrane associated rhomboid family serine protease
LPAAGPFLGAHIPIFKETRMIPLRDSVRSRTFPFVNILLILANAGAFIYELSLPSSALEEFIRLWGLIPMHLTADPWGHGFTVVSSMFLHGGWAHFLGNMLYLWIFGDNVEDNMGHTRYLLFYILVGAAAASAQVFFHPASGLPMIGASGAIAGVLGAYFVLYPGASVVTLVPIGPFLRIMELPAYLLLGLWFVIQALSGVGSITQRTLHGDAGGVAWWAHAGGFAAGVVLVWFFRRRRRKRFF